MEKKLSKKWFEMLKILSLISDEELKAMEHQIPMTQELFDSILNKITGQGIVESFDDFIVEFQEFLRIDEEEMKLYESVEISGEMKAYLGSDEDLEKMHTKIRETYGEDCFRTIG